MNRQSKRRCASSVRRVASVTGYALLGCVVAGSAVLTKEFGHEPVALATVENVVLTTNVSQSDQSLEPTQALPGAEPVSRWFDFRPVRKARTIRMKVTAYSPGVESCGEFADGQTATLHSVRTNGGFLVAADISQLPYGTVLSIPGYANDQLVPVLDCGGAIKGDRLDVLFPTREEALQWGVREIEVTVWEYADGLPVVSPRRLR